MNTFDRLLASSSSSSSASRIRSIPAAQPTARSVAAELLDQAVVAAAAADLRLGAEAVADEGEDRPRVVVEAAHQGAVEGVGDSCSSSSERTWAKCSASSSSSRSSIVGAAAITERVSSSSASKARSGLMSIRSRTSFDTSPSCSRR